MRESSSSTNLIIAGGAVGLLLIGGAVYAGFRLSRSAPVPVAASAIPAANAPAAAPPAAQTAAAPPAAALPQPEQVVLLRLAGSSTLADTAIPRLAAAYLASLGDTGVTTQQNQQGQAPGTMLVSGQRLGRPETIAIAAEAGEAGDAAGLAALAGAHADIAMTTRHISPAELERLRPLGDMSAPASEHAVGFLGEAVIVNPRNPAAQISLAQLRGVVAGSVTSWSALGGAGAIHLVGEPGMHPLAGLVADAPESAAALHPVRNATRAVLDDANAIGIVPAGQAAPARMLAIASVGAAPAYPTPAAIADGSYPLARRLYLYAPAGGANPFAQRFVAFALSAEGQAAIGQAGLVPLTTAPVAAAAPLTPKERYKKLVTGATRLAADLHFEPNSNKLDLHSAREVDRVWNAMMSDHTPPDHLILLGFADNQGTPEKNLALSQQRARVVAEVFRKRGLPPGEIVAFGSDLPIADNATEEGRVKNRRVEVYLKP